jgi:hypothetical protein
MCPQATNKTNEQYQAGEKKRSSQTLLRHTMCVIVVTPLINMPMLVVMPTMMCMSVVLLLIMRMFLAMLPIMRMLVVMSLVSMNLTHTSLPLRPAQAGTTF